MTHRPSPPPPLLLRSTRAFAWALLAAWLLATLAGPARAGAPRWGLLTEVAFEHLTQEQGLPNAIVRAVAEDGDGYVWLGTLGGLARWDGYQMRVWRADPRTPGALPDNVIEVLHGDARGRLWIGTSAAGLVRYDRVADRFVATGAGPQGLSHINVYTIIDDGAGGLWVGGEGGLDRVDGEGRVIERGAGGLQSLPVRALLRDRRGTVWAGTARGLWRLTPGASRFEPVAWPAAETVPPQVMSLVEDGDGRIWIGSAHRGAFVLAGGAGPIVAVTGVDAEATVRRSILAITEARPGQMWFALAGSGLISLDVGQGTTRPIRHRPTLSSALASDHVNALYRDRAGLVWVSTNLGASRHDPRRDAVLTMFGEPPTDPSLRRGADTGDIAARTVEPGQGRRIEVSWLLQTAPDRIWFATHRDGVEVIDPSGARVAALRPDPARPASALPADIALVLAPAGEGRVWIATKRGLYRASADARRVERVPVPGRRIDAPLWALLAEPDTLWVGGQFDGLWRLDPRSGRAQRWPAPGALTDERITALARPGGRGPLWVGTRNGLNRVDLQTGAVLRVPPQPGRADGLTGGFISQIAADSRGRLWVGTYGGGLHLLVGEADDGTPRWRHLGASAGLPDDNINALLEDAAGRLWVSTDNGLAVLDPDALKVQRTLRRADGVLFGTYWTGAALRTDRGELLFGGDGGLTIVRPERDRRWEHQPPVMLTEIRVGGRSVPTGPHTGSGAAPVVVPPGTGGVAVEFAAMDPSAPATLRYAYRLEGFEPAWTEVDANARVASYANLPPGRYTLRVRATNRDGLWSPREASLPLQVQPAWHQTTAARVAGALALLLAFGAAVAWRTRALRARQAELERKVGERTAELEALSRALTEKSHVLEQMSLSDPLTGARNRRFLAEHLEGELAATLRRALDARAQSGHPSANGDTVFLLIDADHFKRINDEHGHIAGDAVLVEFAARLRSELRASDHLVRWGGEEFLVVARETERDSAPELAERLRRAVGAAPVEAGSGLRLRLACSIGWACWPFLPDDPRAVGWREVVQIADAALLAAKRGGRDGWVGVRAAAAARAEGLARRVSADLAATTAQGEVQVTSSRGEAWHGAGGVHSPLA